ncbi:MAG TPA: class I SAM-dependent methyltransferase [Phycisphaerae bacterium]|nr:class I SAM-dependent methyltransferase [Phycisphaerae bacterium]
MPPEKDLPEEFLAHLRGLEESYLLESDPIRQSGFGGGPARWRSEREPILEAVDSDGDLLDVGCANGYLLECLVAWASERGLHLTPHGVDVGARLIELSRQRLPAFATNLHVANAWNWNPPRTYRYVYTLWDCVPQAYLGRYCRRLLARAVAPGGRLIVGAYGSRSRGIPPVQVGELLTSLGFGVAGGASGGEPPITRFAWIDADRHGGV